MKQLPFWRRPYGATRVLEVGGGHNPFRGATHIVERDMRDGYHRDGQALTRPKAAKLIIGDVGDWPFRTATFGFVYASHVLEHVDSPVCACREMMRVAPRGYIETPGPLLEQGRAFGRKDSAPDSFHKWYVFSPHPGRLIFEPKTRETTTWFCRCSDGRVIREWFGVMNMERAQHHLRRSAKTTIFHWRGAFRVEVRTGLEHGICHGEHCRFSEMRRALVANCNDLFRARSLLHLTRTFPAVPPLLRTYGYRPRGFLYPRPGRMLKKAASCVPSLRRSGFGRHVASLVAAYRTAWAHRDAPRLGLAGRPF